MKLKVEGYYPGRLATTLPPEPGPPYACFEVPEGQVQWSPPPGFVVTQVFFEGIGAMCGPLPPVPA